MFGSLRIVPKQLCTRSDTTAATVTFEFQFIGQIVFNYACIELLLVVYAISDLFFRTYKVVFLMRCCIMLLVAREAVFVLI